LTHHEALERSRRARDSRWHCGGDLVDLGPDQCLDLCAVWACSVCQEYVSIDPTGVIRDTGPIAVLDAPQRAALEAHRGSIEPGATRVTQPATRIQCRRSPSGWHELAAEVTVGARDDRRFPSGTEMYLRCRHCQASGRAILEDNQIQWGEGERPPVGGSGR
jgi:hypothetical protein